MVHVKHVIAVSCLPLVAVDDVVHSAISSQFSRVYSSSSSSPCLTPKSYLFKLTVKIWKRSVYLLDCLLLRTRHFRSSLKCSTHASRRKFSSMDCLPLIHSNDASNQNSEKENWPSHKGDTQGSSHYGGANS